LLIGLGLAGMLALAGCGATAGTSSTVPGGPTTDCGPVSVRGSSTVVVNGDKAGPAETCFWQAWQHCQAATLTLTAMGVDAGETRTFTTAPQSHGCGLSDKREHYVIPTNTHQIATFTCASLTKSSDGGLVAKGCGADGDIIIPPPTTGA
jgi:hypothetical protein